MEKDKSVQRNQSSSSTSLDGNKPATNKNLFNVPMQAIESVDTSNDRSNTTTMVKRFKPDAGDNESVPNSLFLEDGSSNISSNNIPNATTNAAALTNEGDHTYNISSSLRRAGGTSNCNNNNNNNNNNTNIDPVDAQIVRIFNILDSRPDYTIPPGWVQLNNPRFRFPMYCHKNSYMCTFYRPYHVQNEEHGLRYIIRDSFMPSTPNTRQPATAANAVVNNNAASAVPSTLYQGTPINAAASSTPYKDPPINATATSAPYKVTPVNATSPSTPSINAAATFTSYKGSPINAATPSTSSNCTLTKTAADTNDNNNDNDGNDKDKIKQVVDKSTQI